MDIKEILKSLKIVLPKPPKPVGSYSAYKKAGNLLYVSGQLPIKLDGSVIKGKIGKNLTLEQGQEAAYCCCLNIIAQLNSACNEDLGLIKNCVKITGFVNSTDEFYNQAMIINPASELIKKIFGEQGVHTRAAVSVNSLPLGAAVEIDSIFEVK